MVDLKTFKVTYVGKWPQRYKVYNLDCKQNRELKTHLNLDGFFNFHISNSGRIVSQHQIVAYYFCGGIHAQRRGLVCKEGEHEVHHINGNTSDNSSGNLLYLPTCVHQEITINQRRVCKYLKLHGIKNIKRFRMKLKDVYIWNRQGRVITGLKDFILLWLERTMLQSAGTFKVSINLNLIGTWRRRVSKALAMAIPTYWQTASWLIII